jgi:predicted Rossmann fold flavoprotein
MSATSKLSNKTLVVIGGGASGFFCAINAAQNNKNLQVILLEKTSKLLSKVRISGGGRCNVTNACFDIVELSKKYPRGDQFLKKAFHWFNTQHTINWFSQRGVALATEKDGRMFPTSNTSQTIIDCLLQQAKNYNVEICTNHDVRSIATTANGFDIIISNNSNSIAANYVCVATGGYPKATMFQWLTSLGHSIQNPIPSLFTFNIPNNIITQLMGLSMPQATIKIVGSKFQSTGALLITHWGLSGPAILKLSAIAAIELHQKQYDFTININWLHNYNAQTLQQYFSNQRQQFGSQKISNKNSLGIASRLWLYFLQISNINENTRFSDLTAKQQNSLINNLVAQPFLVKGKTTFKEEFVTSGGIQLNEVDVNTMQSKLIKGLFFTGEVLNIDGITGGFNFQNAWTTGFIAAKAIAGF